MCSSDLEELQVYVPYFFLFPQKLSPMCLAQSKESIGHGDICEIYKVCQEFSGELRTKNIFDTYSNILDTTIQRFIHNSSSQGTK